LAAANASKASRKRSGSDRPRLAARRRIPAAALELKENLSDTFDSRTSDKEDAAPSLRYSKVLSVQHRPSHSRPEFGHLGKQHPEIGSPV